MKELLRHGLNVDSKDHQGSIAIQIAVKENHLEMVNLGEIGHRITVVDPTSFVEHNSVAVEDFGFDEINAMITDEGAQIESLEVIRDNDKLFIVEDPRTLT
ncbi:KHA domain [Dillenia turbinata]|uniref:KHA domain n=1 Tax=Dillenia turbinata TaxID=194707 RepID=A0AAN8YXK8_9MAGN